MLFLAVFLGFIAENIREHYVERHREHEYIELLADDLEKDKVILHQQIPQMRTAIRGLDSLIGQVYAYLDGKGDTRQLYYGYHHYCRNAVTVQLSESAVNQLKNSGNIRLIRDKQTARLISELEVGFQGLREATQFLKERQEDPSAFGLAIFDFAAYSKANRTADGGFNINDSGFLQLSYQPALNETSPVRLKEFASHVGYYRNAFEAYVSKLESAVPEVDNSIHYLKKTYSLD